MVYKGHVRRGVVVFDGAKRPEEGLAVTVRPAVASPRRPARGKKPAASRYDLLKPVIGKARGLPPDASLNIDRDLYGLPEK